MIMPEKQVKEIDKSLRELFEKGKLAYERNNLDYAITLLQSVLKKEPAFYECREALRATQFKKQDGKTSFFRKMLGSASSSPQLAKAQIAVRNNPTDALDLAESVLNGDPNNIAAHKTLAAAAMKLDMVKTAVLSLELAFKNAPKDKEIGIRLGEALVAARQTGRAEKILKDLAAEHPDDPDLYQAYKDASANHTMQAGKYDTLEGGEGSYRDILRNKDEAVRLEQEQRTVKTEDVAERLIQDQLLKIEVEPNNVKALQKIAELYTQKNDLEKAGEFYQRLLDCTEGIPDPTIQKDVDNLKIRAIDHKIQALDTNEAEYESVKQALEKEKHDVAFESCKKRSENYPSDLAIKFELGVLHYEREEYREAIQLFQKAQANPHIRIKALHHLGRCFLKRGILDLAIRPIQTAIGEKEIFDDQRKDLLYDLGLIYEKMGKPEESIEQFKLIYEVDIDYKDVSDRVDHYYANL
jgi:tetratricopeptide (TPR) repeat protein